MSSDSESDDSDEQYPSSGSESDDSDAKEWYPIENKRKEDYMTAKLKRLFRNEKEFAETAPGIVMEDLERFVALSDRKGLFKRVFDAIGFEDEPLFFAETKLFFDLVRKYRKLVRKYDAEDNTLLRRNGPNLFLLANRIQDRDTSTMSRFYLASTLFLLKRPELFDKFNRIEYVPGEELDNCLKYKPTDDSILDALKSDSLPMIPAGTMFDHCMISTNSRDLRNLASFATRETLVIDMFRADAHIDATDANALMNMQVYVSSPGVHGLFVGTMQNDMVIIGPQVRLTWDRKRVHQSVPRRQRRRDRNTDYVKPNVNFKDFSVHLPDTLDVHYRVYRMSRDVVPESTQRVRRSLF